VTCSPSLARPGIRGKSEGWREILTAAALQGAIVALDKAAVDRGAAEGIRKLTGVWPGQDGEQPEQQAS
jgi:hypothetical protein